MDFAQRTAERRAKIDQLDLWIIQAMHERAVLSQEQQSDRVNQGLPRRDLARENTIYRTYCTGLGRGIGSQIAQLVLLFAGVGMTPVRSELLYSPNGSPYRERW